MFSDGSLFAATHSNQHCNDEFYFFEFISRNSNNSRFSRNSNNSRFSRNLLHRSNRQ
jgi:hypothetical protein